MTNNSWEQKIFSLFLFNNLLSFIDIGLLTPLKRVVNSKNWSDTENSKVGKLILCSNT